MWSLGSDQNWCALVVAPVASPRGRIGCYVGFSVVPAALPTRKEPRGNKSAKRSDECPSQRPTGLRRYKPQISCWHTRQRKKKGEKVARAHCAARPMRRRMTWIFFLYFLFFPEWQAKKRRAAIGPFFFSLWPFLSHAEAGHSAAFPFLGSCRAGRRGRIAAGERAALRSPS